MKITSVVLKNYRMHELLSVDFKPGFNVIVGVNGSGKTSLLKAVCDVLTGFMDYVRVRHGFVAMAERDVALLRRESINGRFRFESCYPVEVSAQGEAFRMACEWAVVKANELAHPMLLGTPPGAFLQKLGAPQMGLEYVDSNEVMPLVAFYRANRQWNGGSPGEMQAATEKTSRTGAYESWADASLDSSAFQGWVIAKCLERFQTSSETGRSFDEIDDDELAVVSAALGLAVEGFKGMRYDMHQKSLLIDLAVGEGGRCEPVSFDNLSDGQRAVIGLVADIARRMCLLNPILGSQVTLQTPGLVLIDELDMHLHPRWQRMLTVGLKRAFPALQFIVASHSPQVIGELHPDEIILLRPGGTAHPQVSYGLDSSQILEEIMGATSRNADVEKRLAELFEHMERNELDLARDEIVRLKEEVPGLPELAGAEALLKRKQVIGR